MIPLWRYSLPSLKRLGHELLEEYIALDYHKGRPRDRHKREYAYARLADKLRRDGYRRHHFRYMKTESEVIEAIHVLRRLITQRKKRITYLGRDRDVYAPRHEITL